MGIRMWCAIALKDGKLKPTCVDMSKATAERLSKEQNPGSVIELFDLSRKAERLRYQMAWWLAEQDICGPENTALTDVGMSMIVDYTVKMSIRFIEEYPGELSYDQES